MDNIICVNKNSAVFYMAVCMAPPHSFITLGFQTEDENIALVDIGKAFPRKNRGKHSEFYNILMMLFSELDAMIDNENIFLNGREDNVYRRLNYSAYEVSYNNYLEFLSLLKSINPNIHAYIPYLEKKDNITFKYASLSDYTPVAIHAAPEVDHLKEKKDKLSYKNNCRHAALDMAHFNLPKNTDTSLSLPTFYNKPFACNAIVYNAKFIQPLYILPAPPTAFPSLDKDKLIIMMMLYQRMEQIIRLDQDSIDTQQKFAGIRTLYTNETGTISRPLNQLISAIMEWSSINQTLVDKHRGFHFFFQSTATRKMIHRIEKEYSNKVEKTMKP